LHPHGSAADRVPVLAEGCPRRGIRYRKVPSIATAQAMPERRAASCAMCPCRCGVTARELLSATLVAGHPGGRATQTSVSARGGPGRGYEQRGHRGYRDRDTRERLPECRDRQVSSVSCAWAGACQAGGCYADSSSYRQAFIVSQVNGTWGTAVEVPAPDSLNAGGNARIRAGTCVNVAHLCAGRLYRDLARGRGGSMGGVYVFGGSRSGGGKRAGPTIYELNASG